MPLISLVVPCYNEEESIPLFQEEAVRVLDEMQTRFGSPQDPVTFELVYVDDGSTDATLPELKRIAGQARPDGMDVRYLSFSRNFGKEAALLAGLDAAHGEYVATMDADMQDPPSLLPTVTTTTPPTDNTQNSTCRNFGGSCSTSAEKIWHNTGTSAIMTEETTMPVCFKPKLSPMK